jgi:asparagine synthetase B (glutamine-hydrolysing)
VGEGADELFAGYVGYRFRHGARRRWPGTDAADFDDLLDADAWEETRTREQMWGNGTFFYERDYAAFRETKAALMPRTLQRAWRHSTAPPAGGRHGTAGWRHRCTALLYRLQAAHRRPPARRPWRPHDLSPTASRGVTPSSTPISSTSSRACRRRC